MKKETVHKIDEVAVVFLVQNDGSNKFLSVAEVKNSFGECFVAKIFETGFAKNGVGTFYARKSLAKRRNT